MNCQSFSAGLRALTVALPYAKKISQDEVDFLWLTLDHKVRTEVTDQMWVTAVKKRLEEENPPRELAIHSQVLRHVYRCENGHPNFSWGLKPDFAALPESPF